MAMKPYQQVFDILKKNAEPQHRDIVETNEKIIDKILAEIDEHERLIALLAVEGDKPDGKIEQVYREDMRRACRLIIFATVEAVDTSGLTEEQHTEVRALLAKYKN